MPFEPGNKLSPGRKGFELEQEQLEKMRRILDRDLAIMERLQEAEELNPVDEKKLAISQARVSKYLDKLHASKQSTDITSGGESLVIQISEAIAKKNGINSTTDTNSTGSPQV